MKPRLQLVVKMRTVMFFSMFIAVHNRRWQAVMQKLGDQLKAEYARQKHQNEVGTGPRRAEASVQKVFACFREHAVEGTKELYGKRSAKAAKSKEGAITITPKLKLSDAAMKVVLSRMLKL
jgi:hypothetical protein